MAQMSKNSILEKLFEIVDTFTPTESGITNHEFTFDGLTGAYFLVTDPPGNIENMLNESGLPGPGLLNCTFIFIYGSPGAARTYNTYAYRSGISGYADYWSPAVTVTGNKIDINLAGSNRLPYRVGYTYYLCRVKQ